MEEPAHAGAGARRTTDWSKAQCRRTDCKWVLDVAFREDESRVRKEHRPENLTVLRHIALNLLNQETTAQMGIRAKRLRAGWDENYLPKVLSG